MELPNLRNTSIVIGGVVFLAGFASGAALTFWIAL